MVVAIVLVIWVQPCRHGPGEVCTKHASSQPRARAFGMPRPKPEAKAVSTALPPLPKLTSFSDQSLTHDSLPVHPQPARIDSLPGQ